MSKVILILDLQQICIYSMPHAKLTNKIMCNKFQFQHKNQ